MANVWSLIVDSAHQVRMKSTKGVCDSKYIIQTKKESKLLLTCDKIA